MGRAQLSIIYTLHTPGKPVNRQETHRAKGQQQTVFQPAFLSSSHLCSNCTGRSFALGRLHFFLGKPFVPRSGTRRQGAKRRRRRCSEPRALRALIGERGSTPVRALSALSLSLGSERVDCLAERDPSLGGHGRLFMDQPHRPRAFSAMVS
jgi:hypothetical protein